MPVQIPTINRNAPQETPTVGRMNVEAPDLVSANAPQMKAAGNLVEAGVNYYDKEQDYAADTAANAAAFKYSMAHEDGLDGPNGARHWKGDPTEAYQKYDETMVAKKNEILTSLGNASDKTRRAVEEKLQSVDQRYYVKRSTSFGAQAAAYEQNVTDANVNLKKDQLMDASAIIDVKDPSTLTQMNTIISDIQDLRLKSGEKQGLVKRDEKGNYLPNPSVQVQLSKDLSEGLTRTIENLNAAGSVDEAKLVQEKFGHFIDPVNKKKVIDSTEKADFEKTAYDAFGKVKYLSLGQAEAEINKIKDPKAQEKVMSLYNSYQAHIEAGKARQSKDNFDRGMNYIQQKVADGTFLHPEDMQQDPQLKRILPLVTDAKQKQAMIEAIASPKHSDPKAVTALNEALIHNFKDENGQPIDPSKFNEMLVGTSKADRANFMNKYQKASNPTHAQEAAASKLIASQVRTQMQTFGIVRKNQFGKYTNEDQVKLNEAVRTFEQSQPDNFHNLSLKEQKDAVDKFVISLRKGKAYAPSISSDDTLGTGPATKFQGRPSPTPTPASAVLQTGGMDDASARRTALKQYTAQIGRQPDLTPGSADLIAIKNMAQKLKNGK